jgi:hypothetical protein
MSDFKNWIKLGENDRVCSILTTYKDMTNSGFIQVEDYPEGNYYYYLYKNGTYIYSPK